MVMGERSKKVTTLGYALLGVLAREPSSGYEVAQLMKQPVGYFWHAGHSQIYPELASLEARGLVAHEVVPQADRPAKKLYSITAAGEAALREWVVSPLEVPAVRDELVLRAYCVWLSDPSEAAALFEAHARHHEAQLAQYEEYRYLMEHNTPVTADAPGKGAPGSSAPGNSAPAEATTARGTAPPPGTPDFASYAALMRGIGFEREYASWCRWMAAQLAASPEGR
jgi:DNA-binding PadR family transcriptional regulator